MPSGYTTEIYDGKEVKFKDFALSCARAFGACVMQRDDPIDEKPKVMPEKSYHTEELNKLKEFKKPTKTEFNSYKKQQKADHLQNIKERNALKKRYSHMMTEVEKWNPPTKDHESLKQFMIEQLTQSIKFDCETDFSEEKIKILSCMSYDDYVLEKLNTYNEKLRYHKEREALEIAMIKQRNKWITDLYQSLS